MIPQAAIAMLACARIGAIHSVVFGGFAAHELAVRIDDAKPKAIVTASCGVEVSKVLEYKPIVDKAIEEATHKPDAVIVHQRPECTANLSKPGDIDWQDAVRNADTSGPSHCRQLIRSIFSTPRALPVNPKGSCETTVVMQPR